MVQPLENLKRLKDNMIKIQWITDSFLFDYNQQRYVVLARLYLDKEKKPDQYALLQLTFFDRNSDEERMLSVPANVNGLLANITVIKGYFRVHGFVPYMEFISEFNKKFGSSIPYEVRQTKTEIEMNYITRILANGDSENPNKIYCSHVKLNPIITEGSNAGERGLRSPFNTQKTKMRRPELYEIFGHDPHISFCYQVDKSKEKSRVEILELWNSRNHN